MKKWIAIILIVIMLATSAGIAGYGVYLYVEEQFQEMFEIFDFDWSEVWGAFGDWFAENFGYQEDVDRETAQMILAEKAIHESKYYQVQTDSPQGWIEKLGAAYNNAVNSVDINRTTLTDLSNSDTEYIKNKSFDLGDEESLNEIYEDSYGTDSMITVLNKQIMMLFSELHRKNNDYGLEKEALPPAFSEDYDRERLNPETGQWEKFVVVPEWDMVTGERIPYDYSNTRIYENKLIMTRTSKFRDTDMNDEYVNDFVLRGEYINEYGNKVKKGLDRVYYEVDKDGEPIIPADADERFLPKKHANVPKYLDEKGELRIHSIFKYNYVIEKKKEPLFVTIGLSKDEIGQMIESGDEGTEWKWDWTGTKYTPYVLIDKEGNLDFKAKKSHFRYHLKDGQVIDTGKENRNEDYIFDLEFERIRAKELSKNEFGEDEYALIDPLFPSVGDVGLGTANKMIQKAELDYTKALSFDEEYDPERVYDFMKMDGWDMSYFTQEKINNGYYPDEVALDPDFREYVMNPEHRAYFDEITNNFGGDLKRLVHFISDDGEILKRSKVDSEFLELYDKYFYDEDLNKRIKIHVPLLSGTGTWLSDMNVKNFIINPLKFYESMVIELNEDSSKAYFIEWDGAGDLMDGIIATYTDVNNLDLSNEYSHNINYFEVQERIKSNGVFTYTSRDMSKQLDLTTEALNIFGRFNVTYEEKEMLKRDLPKQQFVIDVYEHNRKVDLDKIEVYAIYDKTVSYKEYERDGDGKKVKGKDGKYKFDIELKTYEDLETRFSNYDVDLRGYEVFDDIKFKDEYDNENYEIVKALKRGTVVPVTTPEIDQAFKKSFEKAIGDEDELGYVKKDIKEIYFVIKFDDNRDKGSLETVEMIVEGKIFNAKPLVREIFFNGEEFRSFKSRLNTEQKGISGTEVRQRRAENKVYIDQIDAYLREHSYWLPLNLFFDDRRDDVRTEFYQVINNLDFSSANIPYEVQNLRARVSQEIEDSDIKKELLNNSKSNDLALTLILGLITEQSGSGTGNFNISFYGQNSLNAATGCTNSPIDYVITKDEAEDDFKAAKYVVNRFRNLLYHFEGNVPKTIFAYYFDIDFAIHMIEKHPESFAKRSYDQTLEEYSFVYSDRNIKNLDNVIVESVLSYTKNYKDAYDLAKTDIGFWESIYVDLEQDFDDTVETASNVFSKMLKTDLFNCGIIYVDNSMSKLEFDAYKQILFSGLTGQKLSEVDDYLMSDVLGGSFINQYNGDWKSTNNHDTLSESRLKSLGQLLESINFNGYVTPEEFMDFLYLLVDSPYMLSGGRGIVGRESTYIGFPQWVGSYEYYEKHRQANSYVLGSWDCSGMTNYGLAKVGFPVDRLFGYNATSQYYALLDKYAISANEVRVGDLAFSPRDDGTMGHVGFVAGQAEDGDLLFFHMGGNYSKAHVSKVPSFVLFARNPIFEEEYLDEDF